jgi:aminomethyltransferase
MISTDTLHRTPLHALHVSLGAKMVPFAGYDMPVQYPTGIIAEHQHCRTAAALFDVSHMGQVRLDGADVVAALETLVPGDVAALAPMRTRYTMFTLDDGGIIDDLMVTNAGDHLFMVVNAGGKAEDIAHMREKIGGRVKITPLEDRALLALQGPQAAQVMARLAPQAAAMKFMSFATVTIDGIVCFVTRSGYTGEDGYEISVPADKA